MKRGHIVLTMTGASGAVYGLRLGEELLRAGAHLTLLISTAGRMVLREECGLDWQGDAVEVAGKIADYFRGKCQAFRPPAYFDENDFCASIASGSNAPDAMVICPAAWGPLPALPRAIRGTSWRGAPTSS